MPNFTNTYNPINFPMKNSTSPAVCAAAEQGYHIAALQRTQERIMTEMWRKALLDQAKEDGVGIVHVYSPEFPKGGLTCAFMKCTEFDGDVMVDVAVNVCSINDSFSKKIGTEGALRKFYEGETICLPLLRGFRVEDLNFAVKNAFTKMYFLD